MAEHRCFAYIWNRWLGDSRFFERGRRLTAGRAHGRVLEVGAGGGASLPYYGAIDALVAIEPDPAMLRYLWPRLRAASFPAHAIRARGEQIPLADGSVDSAVSNVVYCTVADMHASLREVRRVLRPGGELFLFEHVRGGTFVGPLQDAVVPLWRRLGAGCHPNRRIVEAVREAGFDILELRRGPGGFTPHVTAVAQKPAT